MKFFKQTIIGIDFNDYYAQLIEISLHNNEVVLESYNRALLSPEIIKHSEIVDDEKFKETLSTLLKSANPKPITSRNIAIVFPSAKVFTHIFKMPKNLADKDIGKALEFEAETVIPFSISDVYWDFTVLETDEKSKYVLFVAIIKAVADKYCEVLEAAEVSPVVFGVDVEALKYSTLKQQKTSDAVLVIDYSGFSTNYLIFKNGIVKHFFSTSSGGVKFIEGLAKESGSPLEEILKQKENNNLDKKYQEKIDAYFRQNYKIGKKILEQNEKKPSIGAINEIVITGQFLNLPNFHPIAEEFFPDKHIAIGDPRHYLTINSKNFKPFDGENSIAIYSTYFVNAAGIALRALFEKKDEGINLLPDRLKQKIKDKKYGFFIALSSIFMSFLMLFSGAYMFFKFQDTSYKREALIVEKSNIDNIIYGTRYQDIKEQILNFNDEVKSLSDIDSGLFSLPATLKDIFDLIPKGIVINTLTFSDVDLIISISGVSEKREDLLKATQIFKETKFIESVVTPISNYDQKSKISFAMELKLDFKELKKYGISDNNK